MESRTPRSGGIRRQRLVAYPYSNGAVVEGVENLLGKECWEDLVDRNAKGFQRGLRSRDSETRYSRVRRPVWRSKYSLC